MTEEEIAAGCERGDDSARKALYVNYGNLMLGLIMRYVNDRQQASDLLHDGFINAFQSFDKFTWRGKGSLRAWMSRLFVNQVLMWLRSNRKLMMQMPTDEEVPDQGEEPSYDDVDGLTEEMLLAFIQDLPTGYRTVFNLFVMEGFSHKQIGVMLNISEKSSSSQFYRARMLLAKRIKAYRTKHI
jgi:RNA polymerase sigma-70 factor (ECF subfamily)